MARLTTILASGILLTETIGLICQFVQATDPRFPLVYFTVDSAVLAAVGGAVALMVPRCSWLTALRINTAVGVIASAIVFGAVIAPASVAGTWIQPHDDYWVRTATILMHGAAPVLVAVDFLLAAPRGRPARQFLRGCVWPLAYLVVLSGLAALHLVAMPYPFLDAGHSGWATVITAIAALSALVSGVSAALLGMSRRVWSHR